MRAEKNKFTGGGKFSKSNRKLLSRPVSGISNLAKNLRIDLNN